MPFRRRELPPRAPRAHAYLARCRYQDGVNYARNTRQFQPPRVSDHQVLNIITNSVTPAPQPGKIPVDTRPPFLRSLAALRPADA